MPKAITVRVSSNAGEIRLQSLSGQVTAHTNAGNIDLGSVSGPVEATGHARVDPRLGRVVAFSAAPATVTATSDIGSVTLRVPGNVPYNVTTDVGVGSTEVGASRSPTSQHAITASTRTGSVTIEPAR